MTSVPTLREVMKRLDVKYDDVYHPPLNYATHLWINSWIGSHYRRFKSWLFPPAPNAYAPTAEEIARYEILKDFKESVSVTEIGEASIGLLTVKGSNQRVAEIANTLVNVYLEQRRQRYVDEAEQSYRSLREERDKVLQDLADLDQQTKDFRADTGMLLLFEKDREQLGQWFVMQSAVTELESQIADHEKTLGVLNRQLAGEGAQLTSDRVFREDALKDRLAKLELELAAAKENFQPGDPEIVRIEQEISNEKSGLARDQQSVVVRNSAKVGESFEELRTKKLGIEAQLAGEHAALDVKRTELQRMRQLLDDIPKKMEISHELDRRQIALESKFTGINEKLTQAAVSMATARSAPSAMRVVEYASAPEQPVWPKTKLLLLGAVAFGLIAGVIGALLLELVFVRVNRYRLLEKDDEYRVFAIVDQDEKFLDQLYPAGPLRR